MQHRLKNYLTIAREGRQVETRAAEGGGHHRLRVQGADALHAEVDGAGVGDARSPVHLNLSAVVGGIEFEQAATPGEDHRTGAREVLVDEAVSRPIAEPTSRKVVASREHCSRD